MPKNSPLSPRKQLYFLTVVHTVIDSYATVLPHLLPLLLKKLASQTAARNSLAGIIISVYSTFSSLGQIFFGWASDRFQTLHFVTFGVAFTAIALSLLGIAPSLFLALVLLGIGGCGVAAFHPKATSQAAALASGERGFAISIFLTGGNIGRGLGPLVIMYLVVYRYGLESMPWCMSAGVLIALFIPKILKTPSPAAVNVSSHVVAAPTNGSAQRKNLWGAIRPHWQPLLVLYLLSVVRTITGIGLENFLSLYLDDLQYSNLARSGVIGLFIFAASMGIMVGGSLSDRINYYGLLLFSFIASVPLLYISLHSTGGTFLILLLLGNFVLSSSTTINIVLAQRLLPEHENIASSFMMGAAWSIGGLLSIPVGILGDHFGLARVLDGLVMLPLITVVLVPLLKQKYAR